MQRLRRIVSQLEPQVRALFRRRTSGILLRARLTYWRVRHRLSSLTVDRQGGSQVRVIARLNPWLPTGEGLIPTGEDLRSLIYDAAEAVLRHPDVQAMAARLAAAKGDKDDPIPVGGGIGWPAAVQEMRNRKAPGKGGTRWYSVGGHRIFERRRSGMMVEGVGSYSHPLRAPDAEGRGRWAWQRRNKPAAPAPATGGPPRAKSLIANEVTALRRAAGLTEAQLNNLLRTFVRTGTLPPHLAAHGPAFARLALLMFGRESARSVANVALAPMTLDLMNAGQMSWDQATQGHAGHHVPTGTSAPGAAGGGGGAGTQWEPRGGSEGWGGAYPMSMQGAPDAAEELEKERRAIARGDTPKPRSPAAQSLARREMAVAQRWLRMQMEAAQLYGFATREEALEFITHRLLEFYRMRLVKMEELAPPAPLPPQRPSPQIGTPLRGLLEAAGFKSSRRR